MKNMLVTGGTVFVSRFTAEYFATRGWNVYVLNRGSRPQPRGVTPILCDRHQLGDRLRSICFDAVLDITAYTAGDVADLLDSLGEFGTYIFLSSSAVYPESLSQPFRETQPCGPNAIWGRYGTDKLAAEKLLAERQPTAYILRPPYLYGPMENVYRAPFVFDCTDLDRPFYLPGDGSMQLQFFHVEDLCRVMENILTRQPEEHVFNVGNPETVSVADWVRLCYAAAEKEPKFISVGKEHSQRSYFPFYDYEYCLDVTRQQLLLPGVKPLAEGLREAYEWYKAHPEDVNKKPFFEYIEEYLR